jgi:two-component system chemotaxis response regulator CheY
MRALVVHRSATLRRALENALRRAGCDEVLTASDASQALESCDSAVGLLIAAHDLPGMDGLELVRRVRSSSGGSATRILMVSARSRTPEVLAAVQAGVDAYLLEPFSAWTLEEKIAELLASAAGTGGEAPAQAA